MAKVMANWPSVAEVEGCQNVETCLRWNRFLPPPDEDWKVDVIKAVVVRLRELREADPDAYVQASKSLGWDI